MFSAGVVRSNLRSKGEQKSNRYDSARRNPAKPFIYNTNRISNRNTRPILLSARNLGSLPAVARSGRAPNRTTFPSSPLAAHLSPVLPGAVALQSTASSVQIIVSNAPIAARRVFAAFLLVAFALLIPARRAAAQEVTDVPREEIVANLAAGRVVIAVVKDGIIIATIENPIEQGTLPPAPVQMSTERAGILLGAVEWLSPNSQRDVARLDQALPGARTASYGDAPHLGGATASHGGAGTEATDIEQIGQGVLQKLNQVAQILHGQVDLPGQEPIAEMILADYLPGYGPEVWQASYHIEQEEQAGDYWSTRVLRPSYLQFWPPEKKDPHTLVEFCYPPENPPTPVIDLLRQKDPRIQKIVATNPALQDVMLQLVQGESTRLKAADTIQFLRAVLDAIAPPKAVETMAVISPEGGFKWILAPPPVVVTHTEPQLPRPAGAPSLAHPPDR